MVRPRRRLVLGTLFLVVMVVGAIGLRLGWEWKQALDDIDSMVVPTVILPTATSVSGPQIGAAAVVQPTPQPTPFPAPDRPVNILLLGTDARPGEEISRTDAVIVVHIDPRTDRVSMLSLPRDLLVAVPGYGKHTINAAYPIGEKRIGAGYGAALAKQTVSELLDMPIDHYMLINFEGFKALIDMLDGIWIDVPKPIDDPRFPVGAYDGDNRTIRVHFDAGRQLMDGEHALIYARTRHADSDFGRNQRQQQVLMALFDRIRERGLLSQITSLDDYTESLRDYIRTDLTRAEMFGLASIGPRLSADSIQRYAIEPGMVVEQKTPYALVLTDRKALKQIVNQMLDSSIASTADQSLRLSR